MSYIVASSFDAATWDRHGLNWVRHAKSESLDAIVVGNDIPGSAVDKIAELGFRHLPIQPKFNLRHNAFWTLLQSLEKGQRCLWTKPSLLPKAGIEASTDLVCGISDHNAEHLTSSVVNLHDRAAMIQSLNDAILARHGAFLSSDYVLGTFDFWHGFVGCQTYLHARQYVDAMSTSDDLVLNFFVAFTNSISCKIDKYPTREAA